MSNTIPILPWELIASIPEHRKTAGHFKAWEGPEVQVELQPLANACRASKTLHRLASPILYHSARFYEPDYGDHWRLRSFIATLLDRPELERHVRVLRLEGLILASCDEIAQSTSPQSKEYQDWVRRLANSVDSLQLAPAVRKEVVEKLFCGSYGMFASVLVRLCPRLKVLSISLADFKEGLLEAVLTAGVHSRDASTSDAIETPFLQHLEELHFDRGMYLEKEQANCHISPLLLLPSLRRATFRN